MSFISIPTFVLRVQKNQQQQKKNTTVFDTTAMRMKCGDKK